MGEALADQVRAIVNSVIAAEEFDGRAELLAQVPRLRVVGGPITFLDLAVTDLPSGGLSSTTDRYLANRAFMTGTAKRSAVCWGMGEGRTHLCA
jgi:hypothetical protein